ncbi:agamous-like MADS-box protein AGL103 [Mercurialis annua]|uniref:agamous-like MADS-box protein AGL103 n=1 Tax=Mercurialis annua TaxID=3986 RepID=UPI00215EAAEB|nr:agamous-like MADS-box protein AGL103 [Mercurialis annua]
MENQEKPKPASSGRTIYKKRKLTLKKKAEELSILCGVPVGLVCFDPDGEVDTWPEDKNKVDEILMEFVRKQCLDFPYDLQAIKNKNATNLDGQEIKNRVKNKRGFETWDARFDYLPEESLMEVLKVIERKEKSLEEWVEGELGFENKRKKRIQFDNRNPNYNHDDDDEIDLELRLRRLSNAVEDKHMLPLPAKTVEFLQLKLDDYKNQ